MSKYLCYALKCISEGLVFNIAEVVLPAAVMRVPMQYLMKTIAEQSVGYYNKLLCVSLHNYCSWQVQSFVFTRMSSTEPIAVLQSKCALFEALLHCYMCRNLHYCLSFRYTFVSVFTPANALNGLKFVVEVHKV